MSFDPHLCLNTVLPLAQAAYNPALLPSGWEIIARIEPDDFGYIVRHVAMATPYDADPYPLRSTAAFIIPGTREFEQWMRDFDALSVPALYGGAGHVHHGFQNQYSMIRTSLFAGLSGLAYDELWVLGHSLGGALAQLFARELAMRFKLGMTDGPKIFAEPTVWTFESPRPFWMDAVQDANQLLTEYWRIENVRDIVPHAPPTNLGYSAAGALVSIDGGYTTDLRVAHGLDPSVKNGLQRLIQ